MSDEAAWLSFLLALVTATAFIFSSAISCQRQREKNGLIAECMKAHTPAECKELAK